MFLVATALVASSAVSAKVRGGPAPLAEVQAVDSQPAAEVITATIAATHEPTGLAHTVDHAEPDAEPETGPVRYFNGRPIRPARTVWMTVTAYSPDARSCGKWADGVTASGKSIWTNAMKLVAADTSVIPMGAMLSVPGYDAGATVPVLDRGGAIKGDRLDVLFPSHHEALQWGVKRLPVTIWEYAD